MSNSHICDASPQPALVQSSAYRSDWWGYCSSSSCLKLVPLEGFLIKKDLVLLNNKISEPQRRHNYKMNCAAPQFPNPHVLLAAGLQLWEGNKKKHTASDSEARCPSSLKGAPLLPSKLLHWLGFKTAMAPELVNLSNYNVDSKVCKVYLVQLQCYHNLNGLHIQEQKLQSAASIENLPSTSSGCGPKSALATLPNNNLPPATSAPPHKDMP